MMKNSYLESFEKKYCTSCGACEHFCNKGAIKMQEDLYGNRYPVLDNDKCVDCGMCKKVCSVEIEEKYFVNKHLYAVEHIDENIVKKSQSGGVFTALSDYVLDLKGAVYGVVQDKDNNVYYDRAIDKKKRDTMRGSKYGAIYMLYLMHRENCFECKHHRIERSADISIGDFGILSV